MSLLGWLWLVSPFAVIAMISGDPDLLRLVALHHRRCQVIGWAGVAMMVLGTTLVPGWVGRLMFVIGTPLGGLAVWACGGGGDEGGDDEPDVPPIDWDAFERSFWSHVRRRGRPPRRPRAPSAR